MHFWSLQPCSAWPTSALAADQKRNAQAQSKQTEQSQMEHNDGDGTRFSAKCDCSAKAQERFRRKHQQSDLERAPSAAVSGGVWSWRVTRGFLQISFFWPRLAD